MEMASEEQKRVVPLREIAWTFLIIGATGFGGGMAIVALIQDICVVRKRWLSLEEFSHGVAFGQILGPFAVNATVFVGYRLRGLVGALSALIAFMAPSIAMVIVLASLYFRYNRLPSLKTALAGIGPVVVALILSAAYQIGRGRVRRPDAILTALAAFVLLMLGVPIIWILFMAAIYGVLRYGMRAEGSEDEA